MSEDILTSGDLHTLHRMAAHYRARAGHRGLVGATVCQALARLCDRTIHVIEHYGEQRPEVDYHELERREAKR